MLYQGQRLKTEPSTSQPMGDRQLEHIFLTSQKMPGLAPCLLSFFFKSTFYLIDFSMKPVVAGAKVEGGRDR